MRIFRAITIGVLTGAALFFLPFFILRGFLFILFAGFIIRLVAFGRFRRGGFRGRSFNLAFADTIRTMSEEEYSNFKQKFNNNCGRGGWNGNKTAAEKTTDKQSS